MFLPIQYFCHLKTRGFHFLCSFGQNQPIVEIILLKLSTFLFKIKILSIYRSGRFSAIHGNIVGCKLVVQTKNTQTCSDLKVFRSTWLLAKSTKRRTFSLQLHDSWQHDSWQHDSMTAALSSFLQSGLLTVSVARSEKKCTHESGKLPLATLATQSIAYSCCSLLTN